MPPRLVVKSVRKRDRRKYGYRKRALQRLSDHYETISDAPLELKDGISITPMLQSVDGGIEAVLAALRMHDDEDAESFMELYDQLSPVDRECLTLEEIAQGAGLTPLRLGEIAQSAMIVCGNLASKLLLAASLPSIVSKSIEQAKTTKGTFDREMMLRAGGITPVPKGAQIAIQTNISQPERAQPREAAVWQDAGDRLRIIHEATGQRRLPSPAANPLPLGGRVNQMQQETAEVLVEK